MPTQLFTYPLYSGDIIPLTLNFYQADGKTPLSLVGIVVGTTVKANQTDPDASAIYQKDTNGDATGVINYTIPGVAPGTYWIDVKWWNTAQGNTRQTVIGATQFTVSQSVTQRSVPTPTVFHITAQAA